MAYGRNFGIGMLAAGLMASAASAQVVNPSFEEFADFGSGFLFEGWQDFFANESEAEAFDGTIAMKQFGLFFYQFPYGVDGLPDDMQDLIPTFDLDGDGIDDCCDTIPANNTVVFQDIGAIDIGSEVTLGFQYLQVEGDEPDPAANLIQGALNFRDEPFPDELVGSVAATIDLQNVATGEWVEHSVAGTVPDGTNFVEVVLIQFQFAKEYTPVDANNDGIQDTDGQGFPAFDITSWGGGASHWDLVTIDIADPGCDADFDGNDIVDTRDVLAFLAAWSNQDMSSDCDDNGLIDTRDVLCFLSVWGAGC